MNDDLLSDFTRRAITLGGATRNVYVAGSGPAVIVMCEMPGISPQLARFSRWVRDAGFTVYMPSLFGRDGVTASAEEGADVFRRTCINMEFRALANGGSSPVVSWLRSLARRAHEECGGRGVGAIGMCFTGNFALSMMLETAVVAPVVAQPSMPLEDPCATGVSAEDLLAIRKRLDSEDLTVMAYRFEGDRFCTSQRFAAFTSLLGDRFITRQLPDSAANGVAPPFFQKFVPTPHSVFTAHLIDEEGQPTLAARDEVLAFFAARLSS